MKKFRYVFPISAYVIYALLFVIAAVSVVFAALRLGNAGGFFSVYPVSDILSVVVFCLAMIAIVWLTCFSNYSFTEDRFVASRLFFKKSIRRQDIIKLITDEKSGVSALYYYGSAPGEETVSFLIVSISKKQRFAFESALKDFKSDVVLEIRSEDQAE